jgi:ribonuclease PH
VVITGDDRLVEVQATAERVPFGRDQLDDLLELADKGIARIREAQQLAVDAPRS